MRKEQPPARLNSEQTVTFDANTMMEKNNGLPPLPKTLNHYFSESTYKSSQQSVESSEISSGVSTDRTRSSASGTVQAIDKFGSHASSAGNYNLTNSSRGSASRLFKGVSLCPPIAPKTMISPNLETNKSHAPSFIESNN